MYSHPGPLQTKQPFHDFGILEEIAILSEALCHKTITRVQIIDITLPEEIETILWKLIRGQRKGHPLLRLLLSTSQGTALIKLTTDNLDDLLFIISIMVF